MSEWANFRVQKKNHFDSEQAMRALKHIHTQMNKCEAIERRISLVSFFLFLCIYLNIINF